VPLALPGRRVAAAHRRPDRLLVVAQRRLAFTTLALLVGLLAAIGATTAVLATQSLDAAVDRSLDAAAQAELQRLHDAASESGSSGSESESPGESESEDNSGATPAPTVRPSPIPAEERDERTPSSADTFFLLLDASGRLLDNPERITLPGLPDTTAAAAAAITGRDLRTHEAAGIRVRLLTLSIPAGDDGGPPGRLLQAGFVLTLHDEQQGTLVRAIVLVGIAGLVGAGLVAWALTRRALAPVRDALTRERRFVAGASHELRTPIALIRSSAEVLAREGVAGPDGDRLARDIIAESDRLAGLVGELSELALAEARPPAPPTSVDLADVVRDVASRAEPLAHSSGKWIEAPPAGAIVAGRGDRARLVQVALILVDNAIRHTPSGGTIRLAAAAQGGRAQLSVSDQGPGIPVADRERIFEAFARLPGIAPHRPNPDAGSGLGLAIARSLVEAMGGEIHVEDAPGGGARFVVSIPMAALR
jgi:signal transduction histidine kinase